MRLALAGGPPGRIAVNRALCPRAAFLPVAVALAWAAAPSLAADKGRNSLKPLPDSEWNRELASHLLGRAGFGGTPDEVDQLVRLGVGGAVNWLVEFDDVPFAIAPPAMNELVLEAPDRGELRTMTQEERQKYQQQRQMAERRGHEELRLWWLERMIRSPRPFEERMTLFWHGHFTSGAREVRRCLFMKEQNEFLRSHALDSFGELLRGISRDRAMLVYLDNANSNKSRPNENYARELMELFSLGVGNYSEDDIKAAARAFTGWTYDRDGFVFRRMNHDAGVKTFLGQSGNWDGDDVIDIILKQPACSRFLARTLLEYFVRPAPEKPLVEALAAEIRKQNYELKPVMKTLLASQAFYHADSRARLIKSPVDVIVGTARRLGQPIANLTAAERALANLGQELMQPPNVKGWDGGEKWINTATLYSRYNVCGELLGSAPVERRRQFGRADVGNEALDDGGPETSMKMSGPMEAKSRLRQQGAQPSYDPVPVMESRGLKSAEEIVDFYMQQLLSAPLSAEKRGLLVEFLSGEGEFDVTARGAGAKIRAMIHLMCSTPEFQVY